MFPMVNLKEMLRAYYLNLLHILNISKNIEMNEYKIKYILCDVIEATRQIDIQGHRPIMSEAV